MLLLSTLGQDLAFAFRALRRQKSFAFVCIAILALTLGANTAMFSLVHTVAIAELPVREPERLVVLSHSTAQEAASLRFDDAFFRELQDARDVFDDVLCRAVGNERVTVGTQIGGDAAVGELVCGSYFEALGVKPHLGRLLARGDDVTPGAHPLVVLSHRYWQRRFGADPGAIGQVVRITGVPMTIVGVLPAAFSGLDPADAADLRFPLAMQAEVRGGVQPARANTLERPRTSVIIVGRLRKDVTTAQVEEALTSRLQRYNEINHSAAEASRIDRVHVESAATGIGTTRRQYQSSLRVLITITTSVLAIACLNLANLLLARVLARRTEFAVRLAMGAAAIRLVRQLLTESVLLSLAGAAAGAVVAYPMAAVLIALATPDGSPALAVQLTMTVWYFHAVMALVCAGLFGLLPALAAPRLTSVVVRERSGTRMTATARTLFLAGQVAVSMVVLVGAALFVRSERALRATELGFQADRLLVLALSPQNAGWPAERTLPFFRAARDRVRAVPGVTDATYGWVRPLANASWQTEVTMTGCCQQGVVKALRNAVGPRYFGTLGIPILAGRDFTEADDITAPKVAIVNETFARVHGDDDRVLGARIGVSKAEYTIVGIARDAKYSDVREAPAPVWFVPYEQQPNVKYLDLYARTSGDPSAMIASVRAAIASVDPQVALFDVRSLDAQVDRLLIVDRMLAVLGGFFGFTAAALTGLGLYGILAALVATRAREIAVRLALGARPRAVAVQVTADAWKALIAGVLVGTVAAVGLGRLTATLLFGITPLDPGSYAAAILFLAAFVILATALPLRRTSQTDPMTELRKV